jgi:hypothetical protein
MYPALADPTRRTDMKSILAAVAAAALALVAPTVASAATLEVSNAKPCFGSGDTVKFLGTGFTAGGIVDFSRDGDQIPADPPIRAAEDGTVEAELTIIKRSGRKRRVYAATDRTDPTRTASTPVTVSELKVDLRPRRASPGEARTITAMGFTTGRTLWAHIVFKRSVRTLEIGALKGPCRGLTRRRRLFGERPGFGRHTIHFDTHRRYRRKVAQRASFSFRIFPS